VLAENRRSDQERDRSSPEMLDDDYFWIAREVARKSVSAFVNPALDWPGVFSIAFEQGTLAKTRAMKLCGRKSRLRTRQSAVQMLDFKSHL
jgi:hypothetical protein